MKHAHLIILLTLSATFITLSSSSVTASIGCTNSPPDPYLCGESDEAQPISGPDYIWWIIPNKGCLHYFNDIDPQHEFVEYECPSPAVYHGNIVLKDLFNVGFGYRQNSKTLNCPDEIQ